MEKNNNRSTPPHPSKAEETHNRPQQEKKEQPQEGDIRKVTRSDDADAFDEIYEADQEDQIAENEVKTEDENNTSGNRRGDSFNKSGS